VVLRTRAAIGLIATALAMIMPVGAWADHDVVIIPEVFPKIDTILAPLSSQPAILEPSDVLRVELDPDDVAADATITAELTSSFGIGGGAALLQDGLEPSVPSLLWPDRTVHAVRFTIPASGGPFIEDLYDLAVTIAAPAGPVAVDIQHRAVKVVERIPDDPTIAVIADPSVGDPRPIQEGVEELVASGSPEALIDKTAKTVGNPMNEDRWAALGRAIDEINLVQPDIVVVSGDLTFALYPRPANVEYEDAYRILSRLQVPTYLTPGNHDLYNLDYDDSDRPHTTDGAELWPLYFGPLYWSTDVGDDLHLVGLNTYDWPAAEREPFDEDDDFSTRAGGQIQAEQFGWLADDLSSWRDANPDGRILTVAHHDPSWKQARHPWAGLGRLALRELLAEHQVGIHFAGHTHEDRVARYHAGDIVETNGRDGTDGELHYLPMEGGLDDTWSQEALGAIIRDPINGPLFITTTTVSSVLKGSDWGLGGYWGWRYGTLEAIGTGFDPNTLGYPADRELLDRVAERPDRWNEDHAVYGVFSYPSYHLAASAEGTASSQTVTVTNDLAVPMAVEARLVLSTPNGETIEVSGGTLLRTRVIGDRTEAIVELDVPAESTGTATASVRP
jgi:hypothetical protein